MEVAESKKSLAEDEGNGGLGEAGGEGGGDDGVEGAGGHERHDHPESGADGEGAVGGEDVGVGEQGHCLGLAPYGVQVGPGPLQVDGLDRHHGVRRQARRLVDDGAHPGAYLVDEMVGRPVGGEGSAAVCM